MTRYDSELLDSLRRYYAVDAERRDKWEKTDWKVAERDAFLARLRTEGRTTLLEIGAGTGHDAVFFKEHGFDVTATDLSPEMVERCREKGLDAHVMDFLHLDFPQGSFDAVWALNCLLHVPNADFVDVLHSIDRVIVREGLFFMGMYGGPSSEGPRGGIHLESDPRFFSNRSDDEIVGFASEVFDVVDFHTVELGVDEFHFQAVTLRARVDKPTP